MSTLNHLKGCWQVFLIICEISSNFFWIIKVSEGEIICKKARFAGSWTFLAQLTNNCMQNNSHSNKQLQKLPTVVAMLPKVNSVPVISYFCFGGYFIPCVPQGRARQPRLGWAAWSSGNRSKEHIPAQGTRLIGKQR